MFGAYGFAQGYFGQGPMLLISPVDGPIAVINVNATTPEADLVGATPTVRGSASRMSGVTTRARTPGTTLTARTPRVQNLE